MLEIIWTFIFLAISSYCFWRDSDPCPSTWWGWQEAGVLAQMIVLFLSARVTVVPVYEWLEIVIPHSPFPLYILTIIFLMFAILIAYLGGIALLLIAAAEKCRTWTAARGRSL